MWKKIISILLILVLTGCTTHSEPSFSNNVTVEVGNENPYQSLRLTPQIYNASNSDLSDLLIKDSKGENVPYFINTASLKTDSSMDADFIESFVPAFTIESGEQRTNIIIEGLKNLRLCDIMIHTDSIFKRDARTSSGRSKEIFNLSLNDTLNTDTTIPLYGGISQEENYRITIFDADDKPITIQGITVRYYADDIVFERKVEGDYRLEFGEDATKVAPVYDIERYKNAVLEGALDQATMGAIQYADTNVTPERDDTFIFNIVLVAVTLLLGTVIVLKLKKK